MWGRRARQAGHPATSVTKPFSHLTHLGHHGRDVTAVALSDGRFVTAGETHHVRIREHDGGLDRVVRGGAHPSAGHRTGTGRLSCVSRERTRRALGVVGSGSLRAGARQCSCPLRRGSLAGRVRASAALRVPEPGGTRRGDPADWPSIRPG
ncbi:hypothetical protein GCM10010129_43980 [Streptomyces fumigatiscleroticus]|nr:hypothetical protein GCM10010129_43980 [Streptomyces fumigatiscleroticus]